MKRVKRYTILILILCAIIIPLVPIYKKPEILITEKERSNEEKDIKASSISGGGYIMDKNATFSWKEISISGTHMSTISDTNNDYESISFTTWNFTFYETEYDIIYVSSNGWMSFTEASPSSSYGTIPDDSYKNIDCVALFWDDLLTSSGMGGGGDVYYEFITGPENYLIIEYKDVYNIDVSPEFTGTFEILFYENGTILFQYLNIQNLGYSFAIGLDHGDGTNFNSFEEFKENDLPIASRAISFNFDKLINFTIIPNESDEFTWFVDDIDHEILDNKLGSNWESLFGLPADMAELDKMKVNITKIDEDLTSFKINYSMWDWIPINNSFSAISSTYDNLTYLKDPFDYVSDYNLTNKIPLFIPSPAYGYLSVCDLSDEYYIRSQSEIMFELEWEIEFGSERLDADALYNNMGILTELKIYWFEYDPSRDVWVGTLQFEMQLFYETGPKPNYIGINEKDVFEFGIYYCIKYFPSILFPYPENLPNKMLYNITIEFIGGEDPYLERVPIIYSINSTVSPSTTSYSVLFVYGNLQKVAGEQIHDILSSYIIANNTDWTLLYMRFDDYLNSYSTLAEVTELTNGIIFRYIPEFTENIKYEYIFLSNGVAQYKNYYDQNGNLFMTTRYNETDYVMFCPADNGDDGDKKSTTKADDITMILLILAITGIVVVSGGTIYYKKRQPDYKSRSKKEYKIKEIENDKYKFESSSIERDFSEKFATVDDLIQEKQFETAKNQLDIILFMAKDLKIKKIVRTADSKLDLIKKLEIQEIEVTLKSQFPEIELSINEYKFEEAIETLNNIIEEAKKYNLENLKVQAEQIILKCNSAKIEFLTTNTIRKTILELGQKFGRIQLAELSEMCGIEEKSMIINVIKEMIDQKKINAEYFESTESIVFNIQPIGDDIDKLLKSYDKFEETGKGKKE